MQGGIYEGRINLWQNLQMGAIKSGLEFRTVPTITVGADMCLGKFRWLYQADKN